MLIEFSVANFRSIKKLQTLSLMASPIVSKNKEVDRNNVFKSPLGYDLLKSVAIYGANGSGKSNLLKALSAMLHFVQSSFSNEAISKIPYDPFILDTTSKRKPTFFQLCFILEKKQYRYGFEVKKNKIESEWLFGPANKKEVAYFTRVNNEVKINKKYFPEGVGLEKRETSETTLILNIGKVYKGSLSTSIMKYLDENFIICSGINDITFKKGTTRMLENKSAHDFIIEFLKNADLGITDIIKTVISEKELPKGIVPEMKRQIDDGKLNLLISKREIVDRNNKIVGEIKEPFDLFESEGTKRIFAYSGAIIDALRFGKTIFIDEFDSRLHPILTKHIVEIFNSKIMNFNKAQFVFITHDTNLLDSNLLRRDQIYFVEKNKANESRYYSLVDIGGIRNDASYGKDYIKGKYGAIPYIGHDKNLF